jgi:hypothetical protein
MIYQIANFLASFIYILTASIPEYMPIKPTVKQYNAYYQHSTLDGEGH